MQFRQPIDPPVRHHPRQRQFAGLEKLEAGLGQDAAHEGRVLLKLALHPVAIILPRLGSVNLGHLEFRAGAPVLVVDGLARVLDRGAARVGHFVTIDAQVPEGGRHHRVKATATPMRRQGGTRLPGLVDLAGVAPNSTGHPGQPKR